MNEQTVLTEYFAAAKSHQNVQAAKRRKIVSSDRSAFQKGSGKPVDAIPVSASLSKTTFKASPATTTSSKKLSRKRNAQGSRTRRNVILEKELSEATSIEDDHQVDNRPRKRRTEATSIEDDHQVDNRPRKRRTSTTMRSSDQNDETSKSKMKEGISSSGKTTCQDDKMCVESTAKVNVSGAQQRKGLKINPWISDQAKIVLASRGKRALEKSRGRNRLADKSQSKMHKEQPVQTKCIPKPEKSAGKVGKVKEDIPRLHKGAIGPKKTPSSSVVEESNSKLPAYKRFSNLLEAKKPKASGVTRNLPLPYHFKMLEEFFRCVDVVLSLKQKRYETCTYEKLKESVQEMCRKTFEKKHLAQMKTVYPAAFVFHQQNSLHGQNKVDYQLTVNFNLDELQADPKKKEFKFVETTVLIARQKHFKQELLKITMNHHRNYLAKNYPSISIGDDVIMRWYPGFRLDEVPEIGLFPLPEPPHVKTYSTAQDVLDRARLNVAPRVEKSLRLVAQKSKESSTEVKTNVLHKNEARSNNQNPSLKGISQSLIEKIRQKEEKKIKETLTVDPAVVQKRVMVQRLPELCRILKTCGRNADDVSRYFVSERKAAIPLEDANNKLSESCTSTLSPVQVEKHLKLLSELAPDLVSIMYVRKCPYVKLKKNININNLVEKLKSKEIN